MVKKYKYFLLLFIAGTMISGCKKFLEVQPQDKYTEEQVFSNEKAIQQALNGLYNNLGANSLYGAKLSTTTVELLGQRYNTAQYNSIDNFQYVQQYAYTQALVMSVFDDLWTKAYANVLETNKFISDLDAAAQKNVISQNNANLLKGEAIGIRAMMHFDLLRLYGPVFSASPTAQAIPYYRKADGASQPILPAKQVLDSVLADLSTAKALLAADPVITGGINTSTNFYSGFRNQRLNYYAISALQARAYLYGGNTTAANQAAKQALAEGEKWFPWLPFGNIVSATFPDRVFSTELLFGVYNQNMYLNYKAYFDPGLLSNQILTALPARLTAIFESNTNDYRYPTTWLTGVTGLTFYKFADLADQTKTWRFVQPLIRKSELYYILAETEPDPQTALGYINTVRYNRGLVNLTYTTAAAFTTEIQKEYQKEFWGEGQVFFYYKRRALTSIPSGISGTANIAMSAAKYVVPLPLSETTPR